MTGTGVSTIDWDRRGPAREEAALLLDEFRHRIANEIASALAAMELARNAGLSGPRMRLFEQAIARLDGFARVNAVLAAGHPRDLDVRADIHAICQGLMAGRSGLAGVRVRIDVEPDLLPGRPAARLLLVAAELIHNSIRHALVGRGGRMQVSVARDGPSAVLIVSDDGPGVRAGSGTSGTGQGSAIVEELVLLGDGRIECDTDGTGTTFRVTLPLDGPGPSGPTGRKARA